MSDLRQTAQQALEALEDPWKAGAEGVADAITALRAALAEPVQEPVAWESSEDGKTIQDNDFTHDVVLRMTGDFEDDEQRISYANRIVNKLNAAALAEPRHEPVAWRVRRNDGQYELYFVKASAERAAECYIKRPQVEPLYTAPPQRKPLTEEEIKALIDSVDGLGIGRHVMHKVARAIERAHGIGGAA